MPPKGFSCKQCGHCCLNLEDAYNMVVDEEDVRMWEDAGREDILAWVEVVYPPKGPYYYEAWISPVTREDAARCPWLRKLPNRDEYKCRIQDLKPRHCRDFPVSRKHAKDTGCRGFDK